MKNALRLLAAAFLFIVGALLALMQLMLYRDTGAAVATLLGACVLASIVSPFSD